MMNSYSQKIGIFLLLICTQIPLFAQHNWRLAKEKNNIKIYTAEADFGLDYVNAKLTINSSIDKILEVITDHSNFVKWSYNCLESKRLEKVSDTEYYVYFLTDAPWPVSDRDDVTRQRINYLLDGSVKVEIEDFPDKIPHKKGVIRIPYLKGYWLFQPLDSNKTSVEYFLHASPGGNIPDWLGNTSVTDAPYETLKAFRAVVEKGK